ncbi:MAG: glycosyltransferase family 4 protein, partial [Actinobacteria bacterium]|nr:glycosyltransferase family 4 protein [Actinomycetota bacterium]
MENEVTDSKKRNSRLLIISHDVVGRQMAGPGIRFYEFAKILSNVADVTLASPNKIDIDTAGFKTLTYNSENYKVLKRVSELSDMIIIQGHILHYFPFLKHFKGKIIIDLYNPFNLESLEMYRNETLAERLRIDKSNVDIIKFQLAIGDFFICASDKQRSYWLGLLSAMGRVNPFNYDSDNSLRKLIDIVPFGIPSTPPKHTGESIRKLFPSIREEDKLVLWGGGIWNWLDPITAIKAMWEISRSRKDIKLIFVGVKHPDPKLPKMKKAVEVINLSKELDLFDKIVFFNEWVPYELRQNFLLESSAGLSIHHEKIETEFSYRTRVMDYIWAKVPVITTTGESIAKLVKAENIGEVVKYENTNQLARVIESVATNSSLRDIYIKNIERIIPNFYWENVTKPLVEYCSQPYFASDKKSIMEMLELQNSKIINILDENISGSTNTLVLTSNLVRDRELLKGKSFGKIFYVKVDDEEENEGQLNSGLDKVGYLKSKIISRTRFDSVIINNAFSSMSPKFFYDLLNIIGMKLKADGILFLSLPEEKGIARALGGQKDTGRAQNRIDEFTLEYIFKNTGYEIIQKGIWDRMQSSLIEGDGSGKQSLPADQPYAKNELMDLFEIKYSSQDFKELSFLKRFNILDSDELKNDLSIKGKIKKHIYAITGMYLENLRRSYNSSINSLSNNIHLQINREINELNTKNRERMIFIYYNIFKTLQSQVSSLGMDLRVLRRLVEQNL